MARPRTRWRIVVTPPAKEEMRIVRAWWRRHRLDAPFAIRDALNSARTLLARHPEAAPVSEDPGLEGFHCLLLPTIEYFLYYETDEVAGTVLIQAFWHAKRLRPKLRH